MVKPEDIGYLTELDKDFAADLTRIGIDNSKANYGQFQAFLDKYQYWLDGKSKALKGHDWKWICFLVADCRTEKVIPQNKHKPAMDLMMPEKIFKISMQASSFKVPWGAMYLRSKQENLIDY